MMTLEYMRQLPITRNRSSDVTITRLCYFPVAIAMSKWKITSMPWPITSVWWTLIAIIKRHWCVLPSCMTCEDVSFMRYTVYKTHNANSATLSSRLTHNLFSTITVHWHDLHSMSHAMHYETCSHAKNFTRHHNSCNPFCNVFLVHETLPCRVNITQKNFYYPLVCCPIAFTANLKYTLVSQLSITVMVTVKLT